MLFPVYYSKAALKKNCITEVYKKMNWLQETSCWTLIFCPFWAYRSVQCTGMVFTGSGHFKGSFIQIFNFLIDIYSFVLSQSRHAILVLYLGSQKSILRLLSMHVFNINCQCHKIIKSRKSINGLKNMRLKAVISLQIRTLWPSLKLLVSSSRNVLKSIIFGRLNKTGRSSQTCSIIIPNVPIFCLCKQKLRLLLSREAEKNFLFYPAKCEIRWYSITLWILIMQHAAHYMYTINFDPFYFPSPLAHRTHSSTKEENENRTNKLCVYQTYVFFLISALLLCLCTFSARFGDSEQFLCSRKTDQKQMFVCEHWQLFLSVKIHRSTILSR